VRVDIPWDHRAASRRTYFAAHELSRAAMRRTDAQWLTHTCMASSSRFVIVHHAQSLFQGESELICLSPSEVNRAPELLHSAIFLAEEPDGSSFFALDLTDAPEQLRLQLICGRELRDIKPLATRLPAREAALLAYARAITYWHQTHRFCGRCGEATRSEQAGHLRVCTRSTCARQHFPRTDPAVIMLITCGERALLARHPQAPPTSFATLAGFVEPGESLEAAVAREAYEETGLYLHRVWYHSSQPWPFPGSIMLGFMAEAASEKLRLDPMEVAEARWLTREELRRQVSAGELALPSKVSIAYRLVEDWLTQRNPI
jgi:NAD+ diphosphatase